jgi:hypothetical protein
MSAYWHIASVCPGMADGRFRRKADIVRHWREPPRQRLTQNRCGGAASIDPISMIATAIALPTQQYAAF